MAVEARVALGILHLGEEALVEESRVAVDGMVTREWGVFYG